MTNEKTMAEILADLEPRRATIIRHSFGVGVERQTLTTIAQTPAMSGADRRIRPQAVQHLEADAIRSIWAFGNLDRFFELVQAGRPDGKLTAREVNLYERQRSLPTPSYRLKRRPPVPFHLRPAFDLE